MDYANDICLLTTNTNCLDSSYLFNFLLGLVLQLMSGLWNRLEKTTSNCPNFYCYLGISFLNMLAESALVEHILTLFVKILDVIVYKVGVSSYTIGIDR